MESSNKLLDLGLVLDIGNYEMSLHRWQKDPELRQQQFDQYLAVVKPLVHRYHRVLKAITPDTHTFFTNKLNKNQVSTLKSVYRQLAPYDILSKQVSDGKQQQSKTVVSQQEYQELSKGPKSQMFIIPLEQQPSNDQYQYWHSYIPVKEAVHFSSVVIHGKGVATKELGFPTANLELNQQAELALKTYPNGVYLVQVELKDMGFFKGICCIGTNPHHQNNQFTRFIQVYIYHKFQELFYGNQIKLTLLALTRFQGKFQSYDSFLNALHNDIYAGKQLVKKMQESKL